MIWTRATGAAGPVALDWTVAIDAELREVVATGTVVAAPERDHAVHVVVTGLAPATTYHYAFAAADERSTTGRTRTLPGAGARHLRLAVVSCARLDTGFFNGYARIAERDDIDFVLHLGDYIYEGSNFRFPSDPRPDLGRAFEPDRNCVTLDDYRTRWAQYCRDPDVQAFRAAHPVISTVDDHEFADGVWSGGSNWHTAEDGPFAARLAAAFRARWEWMPVSQPDPDDPDRVFQVVPIGGLADLVVTDIRTRRDEPVAGPAMADPARTILGSEQRAWLFDALDASDARWRILANSSLMGGAWSERVPAAARTTVGALKLLGDDGAGPDPDQWDGYPAERAALLRHVGEQDYRNLVVLSGDVHVAVACELSPDIEADHDPVAVEFVTASLTSPNLDDKMGWPPRSAAALALESEMVAALPHWKWCNFDDHGYVIVDVTPDRIVAEWRFVSTVLRPAPGDEAGGHWMVEHGRPVIVGAP